MSCVPPWQREQLPLIYMDETLVMIPNVDAETSPQTNLVDAKFKAASDEMGLLVSLHINK